jgi:hypothetical protein
MTCSIISKTEDEKTRLQALALINDVNKYRTKLVTNGVIVNDPLLIVQSKMEHLKGEEKKLLHNIKDKGDTESGSESEDTREVNSSPGLELKEQQTLNGIF